MLKNININLKSLNLHFVFVFIFISTLIFSFIYFINKSFAAPDVPEKVVISSFVEGDNFIELRWTAPNDGGSPITSYLIGKKLISENNWSFNTFAIDASSTLVYTDSSVLNGQSYQYIISATNLVGTGQSSNYSTLIPYREIPSPANLAITNVSTSSVALAWDIVSEAEYYTVSGSDYSGTTTNTFINISGLTPYLNQKFSVQANTNDNSLRSKFSNEVSTTTLPVSPKNLFFSNVSTSSLTLSWDLNYASGYLISFNGGDEGSTISTTTNSITNTVTFENLTPKNLYSFSVYGFNTFATSTGSVTATTTLPLFAEEPTIVVPAQTNQSSSGGIIWFSDTNNRAAKNNINLTSSSSDSTSTKSLKTENSVKIIEAVKNSLENNLPNIFDLNSGWYKNIFGEYKKKEF